MIHATGTAPWHLISDKGSPFWPSQGYKRWCRQHEIRPRFGAIGQHGSIAVIERAFRTIKDALRMVVVATRRKAVQREIAIVVDWYNQHRPHTTLGGKTPDEVYFERLPSIRKPRLEPRPHWPRGSPCAKPQALVAGRPGAGFDIDVAYFHGYTHLPIVRLRRAG